MKRAHVKGEHPEAICNSPRPPFAHHRFVSKAAILKMTFAEACQRCHRIVLAERGVKVVRP